MSDGDGIMDPSTGDHKGIWIFSIKYRSIWVRIDSYFIVFLLNLVRYLYQPQKFSVKMVV